MMKSSTFSFLAVYFFLAIGFNLVHAQDSLGRGQGITESGLNVSSADSLNEITPRKPVVIFEDTVFYVYAKIGSFTPEERAKSLSQRVESLVNDNHFDADELTVVANEETHDIMHGDLILWSVTERDAFWLNESRSDIADRYLKAIQVSVAEYRDRISLLANLKRIGLLSLVLLSFIYGVRFLNRKLTALNDWIIAKGKERFNGIKLKDYELLSVERQERFARMVLKALKWLVIALVVYLTLPVVFSIFPATEGVARALISYFLSPVKMFGSAILGYIPELITVVVILYLTHWFVRFLRFLSLEIQYGKLEINGFYPEWAAPTFALLRVVIYAFSFVIIFPYLPGSDSPIFRGVSVFFGLLLSLGSSSAIGNIIAGLVITYMRPFKIGDRVKVGDALGDVVEKTMLVTRIRTNKNEDVTIPNSAILNGNTINYSSNASGQGLILNSTVTIGYDVSWRRVHELLINAALKTENILAEPKPFVLQTSLDDYYVSYQINAYTNRPGLSASIYSALHANIQDSFNEAGVEILSPHYRAGRDGNAAAIPSEYLSDNSSKSD